MLTRISALLTLLVILQACDPCFGTPSCEQPPAVSYGGQFIEHTSGLPVAGVRVAFVPRPSFTLTEDTLRALSDDAGFFLLRGDALVPGAIVGDLVVTPPPPHTPYTVQSLRLETSTTRGDGLFAGRLVVDPYYPFVGEVRDRVTGAIVPGAEVRFERTGGTQAEPDTFVVTTDSDGRVFVEMRMHGAQLLLGEATVTAPGYPRPYRMRLRLRPRYIDRPAQEVDVMKLGSALQYVAVVQRRGASDVHPGTRFEFRRTGGIRLAADTFAVVVPASGAIFLPLEALEEGAVQGEVMVRPPVPFPTESFPVELRTMDGDTTTVLRFGYGTQVYARARFHYRATALPVAEGVQATLLHRGGMQFEPAGVLTLIDSTNTFRYTAATADTGETVVDIEVRLREPFDADTLRSIRLRSRRDSMPNDLGSIGVGRWLPWSGVVVDATTGTPIAGARVTFRRTAGIVIAPTTVSSTSDAAGTFRVAPGAVPLRDGDVIGDLAVSFESTWRDTTITGLRLRTSSDDTARVLPSIQIQRRAP